MYLSQIKMKEIQSKPGNNNWIFIYDRSGSMTYVLKKLGEDIVRLGKMLKVGDTLSLAYFSGKGQYQFILKGFQITSDSSIDAIQNVIQKNITSIGLTCFSEVLCDSVKAIKDLQLVFPDNSFVLCFLTDGVPIPGGKSEEDAIFKVLGELRDLLGDALFVGYGDYYGKELMAKMTAEVGGSFAHADEIEDFSKNVEVVINTGKASKKITVDISGEEDVILVFGKSNGQVKVYPHKNGKAFVSDSEKEVFCVTPKPSSNGSSDDNDNIYAGAYSLASQGKIQESLEWLGKVGDKFLVDKLNNAYTVSETGEAIQLIHEAAFDESKRMLDGYRKNYVPKADAFCILDAIDILVNDDESYFYPTHSKWEYKRIGVSFKPKEGYAKFIKGDNKCSFSRLSLNKKRLNLSVGTSIFGHIELNKDHKKFNLPKKIDTKQFKTYSIISDGVLNVRMVPSSMSREAFMKLRKGGLIKKTEKWVQDEIYVLDFKRIPMINRNLASSYSSATDLAEATLEENRLMAELKTLKYLKDYFSPEKYKATPFTEKYNDDQLDYLFEQGIAADGSYKPQVEKQESTDYYNARTFEVKVSGFSSIPAIKKTLDKAKEKKKLNAVESIIVKEGKYIDSKIETKSTEEKVEFIDSEIERKNAKIKGIRRGVQRAKFAVILGKGTFEEFGSNEGEIDVDGTKVKFVFGEEQVKY